MNFGFVRAEVAAEELPDGRKRDRQRISASTGDCPDRMGIRPEHGKALGKGPHFRIVGVQDVRPVGMQHDAGIGIAVAVTVTSGVVEPLHHDDLETGLGKHARHRRAGKASANHQYAVAMQSSHPYRSQAGENALSG